MVYTDRIDGYQIMDMIYLGKPPEDAPPTFDIVKWEQVEPFESYNPITGQTETRTEYFYTVARLEWDIREKEFNLSSYDLRLLEERPSDAAIEMMLRFCEEKGRELEHE